MQRMYGLPMLQALAKRLYARLWLVLIVVVAFITVSVGYVFSQFVESPLLEVVMKHAEGNQSRAAEWLGINRNTLRRKLVDHKLIK